MCTLDGCPKGQLCNALTGACAITAKPCGKYSCVEGFACDYDDGRCKPACVVNGCLDGGACDTLSGRCVFEAGEEPVGVPCAGDGDCAGTLSCATQAETGMPGGLCTQICTQHDACPMGSVCSYGVCLAQCGRRQDCRDGYRCIPSDADELEGPYVCFPLGSTCALSRNVAPTCTRDADCREGRCQSGRCGCQPEGAGCGGDEDCVAGAICLEQETFGIEGGYCTSLFCDRNGCNSQDSTCMDVGGGMTACMPGCALGDPRSCAVGAACEPLPELVGTPPARCRGDQDCAAGLAQDYCAAWGESSDLYCTDPYGDAVCYPFSACKSDRECGACSGPRDCAEGSSCVAGSGTCERTCVNDRECGWGRGCQAGLCHWRCDATAGCRGVGGTCDGAGLCTFSPQHCDPVMRRCTAACDENVDCDLTRTCDGSASGPGPGAGRCYLACEGDGECGEQGVCKNGGCAARCTFTGCGSDLYCDSNGSGATQECTPCTVANEARICGPQKRCHADGRCGGFCTDDESCGGFECEESTGRCVR